MYQVCVHLPHHYSSPRIFNVDSLDEYFILSHRYGGNWVLLWIKDDQGAYHYACVKKDGDIMQRHCIGFNSSPNRMHMSSAYLAAKDKPVEPVKLAP